MKVLTTTVLRSPGRDGYPGEVGRVVERSVVNGLMRLAAGARAAQVRAEVIQALQAMKVQLGRSTPGASEAERANRAMLAAEIGRWLERRWDSRALPEPVAAPPGSPIGDGEPPPRAAAE